MTMDLDQFKEQITFLNDKVNSFHIDVMDGHFVPNITLSPWFVEQVRKISDVPMSAHMMVMDAPLLGRASHRGQVRLHLLPLRGGQRCGFLYNRQDPRCRS